MDLTVRKLDRALRVAYPGHPQVRAIPRIHYVRLADIAEIIGGKRLKECMRAAIRSLVDPGAVAGLLLARKQAPQRQCPTQTSIGVTVRKGLNAILVGRALLRRTIGAVRYVQVKALFTFPYVCVRIETQLVG